MEKVIVEVAYTRNNYSAHIPKLPGVVTTGDNIDEIEQNIKEVIPFLPKIIFPSSNTTPHDIWLYRYQNAA